MPLCFAVFLALAAQTPKVTLAYFQEHFIVRDGIYNESAPLKLPPESPKLSTVFRRNSTFAVWDERGITIRVGKKVKSTKLPDIATSPRAFSRPEIRETLAAIREKKRTREVSALSGAVRVGNHVYFLGRWDDNAGKPWAEALVQVDLSDRFPTPKLVGRPDVLSLADKPIDDQLQILDGLVSYTARKGDHWGVEQYNTQNGRFTFDELGGRLESYQPGESKTGYFIEKTSYGTTVAGRIDLRSRTRHILAECRSRMRFIDASEPPCIVVSNGNSASLLSAATGAMMDLPVPSATRRTSLGIVIWTPVGDPKRAWLYDPARWQVRAWWNSAQGSGGP